MAKKPTEPTKPTWPKTSDDPVSTNDPSVVAHTYTMAETHPHPTPAVKEVSEIVGMLKAFQAKMDAGGLTSEDKAEFDRAIVKLQLLYDKPGDVDPIGAPV